jgi:DNA processing protein
MHAESVPTEGEKLAQLALRLTPGVGDVLLRYLVGAFGSAAGVLAARPAKLEKVRGIGPGLSQLILKKSTMAEAERLWAQARRDGAKLLFFTDPDYPDRMRRLYDAPTLLFFRGNADLNAPRTIAIVGTRQATEYGRRVSEEIVEDLVKYNALVVSGLAFGIDIAAHRAALRVNLPTVAVMASGPDIIYPAAHAKTARQLTEMGGLLTEHPFGTQPDARFFAARNRIIAGLSDAIVVVESARKGGGLITAEYANNYHRDVLAVPGDLKKPLSEGCNDLIRRNKALIYTDIGALAEALNWELDGKPATPSRQPTLDFSAFTDEESQVLALLRQGGEVHVDDLALRTNLHHARLAPLLLNLEFQGLVKTLPGKRYALC